jgi:hypothetical protein
MRKFLITVALYTSTALVSVGVALPASATTAACRSGSYAGLCGTMVDHENFPLAFDSRGQRAANNTPIIGFPNLDGDAGSDFVVLSYRGRPGFIFIFAPNGEITNMCIANPARGFHRNPGGPFGLILRPCNGSVFQRFTKRFVGHDTFVLTSLADNRIIHSNGEGASLTVVRAPALLTGNDLWSFAH